MKKKRILIIGLPAVAIIIALLFLLLMQKDEFSRLKGKKDYNYILVSVDTLRADRIGCYGFSGIETPTIDLFAERGVRFEQCIAQTPLTLPSHTSLLTGTQPTFHGVRDNGGFLVPQELVTLAEVFKEQDYQTAAFVAAYVLDSKWGLNQGYDFYFDRFDLSKYKTISLGNVQRRGDEVIDETINWLGQNRKHKFFTWIHLYDPHTPYDPPSPFKEKYPNRHYLGEIAYTDDQLGRLWRYLEDNDLVNKTILVFVSDHGESLGEHKESTHGFFIYQEGIHVPLIFVTPFEKLHGITRSSVVSLVDVMPTILEMADVPIPTHVQGHSLLPLFMGDEELKSNFAYSETFYPRFHYGWSELTSVQDEQFKLIIAPRLELYDLLDDPEERNNLLTALPGETRRLKNLADDFIERSSQNALQLDYSHIDEEARQKLTALGYIGTFTDLSSLKEKRPGDPKDKIVVFNQLSEARELGLKGNFDQAERLVEQIIQDDPDVIDAYFTLGNLYFKEGKFEEALESFFKALERKPDDAFTAINIANSYISMGDFNEAETFLQSIIDALPPDSQIHFILGNINYFQKEYEEALKNYKKCLELNPSSASAYNGIGGIYVIQGNLDEAENSLEKAADLNPQLRNLHYNLAQLYEERSDLQQAIKEYQEELENIPHNFRASFNLSRIYRILGQTEDELEYLKKTRIINPNFPLSYFYLARIYLNRGENYDEAISLAKRGIELKPEEKDLPLGFFLLADLYNRIGDSVKSSEYARKGKELVQSNSKK
jgi:arylsulfatase A-like enzyme/predicted Zn-dependent protease